MGMTEIYPHWSTCHALDPEPATLSAVLTPPAGLRGGCHFLLCLI